MRVKVNVTTKVLERAKMCGFVDGSVTESCMLALAFRDLFPDSYVVIDTASLLGYIMGGPDQIHLPAHVVDKRALFDSLQPHQRVLMTPFSFEIEVPEYVINKIGLGQIYKILSESSTMELVMHKEETK